MLDVDALAAEIRRVDGNDSLGAGALAEALMPFIIAEFVGAKSVKVAALEWEEDETNWWKTKPNEIGLGYEVRQTYRGTVRIHRGTGPWANFEGSVDEAKAAFQADYDNRVFSNITIE